MSIANLRNDLKNRKIVFGTERTIKFLKNGKLERVYLSGNCPENIKKDIIYYGKLAGVLVEELKESNEDLGVICKRPFLVSVLSVLK